MLRECYPFLPHSLSIYKVNQLTRFHTRSESLLILVPLIQKLINWSIDTQFPSVTRSEELQPFTWTNPTEDRRHLSDIDIYTRLRCYSLAEKASIKRCFVVSLSNKFYGLKRLIKSNLYRLHDQSWHAINFTWKMTTQKSSCPSAIVDIEYM